MSYVNASVRPADRAKAVLSVIGIHALIGFGVITGLAVTGQADRVITIFKGENIPEPPPPPPPVEDVVPVDTPVSPPMSAPKPPIDFTRPSDVRVVETTDSSPVVIPNPGTIVSPNPVVVPSPPAPTPAFTPRGASPRNGPTGWITNNDYSNADLRRGNEGTARYRLVVGSDGRVDACEITASTGHSTLDRATCRLITSRARFDAATGGNGERVVGTYSGTVTWQIPE